MTSSKNLTDRRGYLYITTNESKIADVRTASLRTSELGAGPLIIHTSKTSDPPASPERFYNSLTSVDLMDGTYVVSAVSGYGIMSACGVGELLAKHVAGRELPDYAPAFALIRYDDPEYQKRLESWDNSGQL